MPVTELTALNCRVHRFSFEVGLCNILLYSLCFFVKETPWGEPNQRIHCLSLINRANLINIFDIGQCPTERGTTPGANPEQTSVSHLILGPKRSNPVRYVVVMDVGPSGPQTKWLFRDSEVLPGPGVTWGTPEPSGEATTIPLPSDPVEKRDSSWGRFHFVRALLGVPFLWVDSKRDENTHF